MATKYRRFANRSHIVAPPKVQDAPPRRVQTRSANFVSIYTNDIQLMTSSWDIRMILGELGDSPSGDNSTVGITQLGEVRMSPQLAKKLTLILIEQLKAYEQQFGEIPLAKEQAASSEQRRPS
jgi:hypothetical protein